MTPDQPNSPGAQESSHASAKEAAQNKGAEFREKAHSAKENMKEKSASAVEDLKGSGHDYASGKKAQAADRIGRYGEEFDEAAKGFEEDDPNIAWFTHQAADRLGGFADRLRDSDFRTLWNDADRLARRHPLAFVGGMFAAGAAVGTFVRSSRADLDDDEAEGMSRRSGAAEGLEPEDDMLARPSNVPTSDI